MNKSAIATCCFLISFLTGCNDQSKKTGKEPNPTDNNISINHISGTAPSIYVSNGVIHLAFASGDSILYCTSTDKGQNFTQPFLVGRVNEMAVVGGRGPQVAGSEDQLVIAVAGDKGNIYSYTKSGEKWISNGSINDVPDIAKEGFVSLAANGSGKFYAVWLDLRKDNKNKIGGSVSTDGGKTWSVNKIIYRSPDLSVCECCKPSVVMKNDHVAVMFRNWINGNRDLYMIQSQDGGNTFGEAEKLGKGSWSLKGCPMDGGGLVIDKDNHLQTVWRREDKIFSSAPGVEENEIGKGKSCTMETVNGKNVYAWVENGEIVIMKPRGMKKVVGTGKLPVIKSINNEHIVCTWEQDKQINEKSLFKHYLSFCNILVHICL